jgi:LPXTG-motif cell wall-anchored protein
VVPEGPAVIGELAPPAMPVYEPPLEARADLPKTASDTFVILFAGIGLLFGALMLKGLRTTLE